MKGERKYKHRRTVAGLILMILVSVLSAGAGSGINIVRADNQENTISENESQPADQLLKEPVQEEDRIYISTAQELIDFSENCSLDTWSKGKTVILLNDISVENMNFLPIPVFAGTFDGGGHEISGLDISGNISPAGLFGILSGNAVVKNLSVSGNIIPSGDGSFSGGIAGENNGTISDCSFKGTVSAVSNTGGIAGINSAEGSILNCRVSGAVFGKKMTGGIAGYNLGLIKSCENSGYVNISSVDPSLGLEHLKASYFWDIAKLGTMDISSAPNDTGGIAGYSSGAILECTNHSTVGYQHIGYNVGGIAGRSCGYIYACTNSAEIYGRKDVGGIVGQAEPFVELDLTEGVLSKLKRQFDELSGLIDQALIDADDGVGTITHRLTAMADCVDTAAAAAENITTTGSISSTVTGEGQADGNGSVTVNPPDFEAGSSAGAGGGFHVEADSSSVSVDGSIGAGSEIHAGLTEGSTAGEHSGSASGALNANTQIVLNTSLHELKSAVNGLTGQMRLLNGETGSVSGKLDSDLQAVNHQINAISDTLFDAVNEAESASSEDILKDTSDVNIDQVTDGKVMLCRNEGTVNGDLNIGGITGAMAVEYELDPEDDVTAGVSGNERRRYELKAIIQLCENAGNVEAKRDYAGSVCGRMDLGLIAADCGYGDTTSESGDYVGGIAGLAGGTVRDCFSKCTLKGKNYVGGIVGSGITETAGGSSSLVSGCYSLVDIPEYEQFAGAVAGVKEGQFIDNYFVSDQLGGINRTSFTGEASPITYEQLLTIENLPEEFKHFSLTFSADGTEVKSDSFDYGNSFDSSVFPAIPEKEGYYARWDTDNLDELHFDRDVKVVYTPFLTAIESSEVRSDGRPVLFAEGDFSDSDELSMHAQGQTPEEFHVLSCDFKDAVVHYLSDIGKSGVFRRTINREVVEQWSVEIPDDGQESHMIRYLSPDGKTSRRQIYLKEENRWVRTDASAAGSYLVFSMNAETTEFAVVSTINILWVWIIPCGLAFFLVCFLVFLIRRSCKKLTRRGRRKIQRRTQILLLILLVILLMAAAAAVWFFTSGAGKGLDVSRLLKDYSERPEYSMSLSIEGKTGEKPFEIDASISGMKVDGRKITCIERSNIRLYYCDGMIFLDDGQAFQSGELFPDYSQLISHTAELYRITDIEEKENSGDQIYRITVSDENANTVLRLLAPSVSDLTDSSKLAVELSAEGRELSQIRFSAEGNLKDQEDTPFIVEAELATIDQNYEPAVPEAVLNAISAQKKETAASDEHRELTEDEFRLLAAFASFDSREKTEGDLSLSADCGPLLVSDNLKLYSCRMNGITVRCIKKNSTELYFSKNAVCNQNGLALSASEEKLAGSADLLRIAREVCRNTAVSCMGSEDNRIYTFSLNSDGMEAVARAIVPDLDHQEPELKEGTVVIELEGENLKKINFSCSGSIKIVLSDTPVELQAQLVFHEGEVEFDVPENVAEALRQIQINQ